MAARVFSLRWLNPRNWNARLLWDVFMVWVALANVTLIVFDLTYLIVRPYYRQYVPPVLTVYDPVLGIAPHPLTEALLDEADATEQLLQLDPNAPRLRRHVDELRELTRRVLREDPFERSGQSRTLEVLKALIGRETDVDPIDLGSGASMVRGVEEFWSTDPAVLAQRLQLFDTHVVPLLRNNYYREVTLDGRLVNHFWLLDLPFLSLFLLEFCVRWSLSLRRREYPRWFFFPIFNWYDVLGLIPVPQFRPFRLLRVVSIYMRLRRSEASRVGRDVFTRAVAYISNIIAEEISDVVSLRILNETQAEIRDGTHRRIFDATVRPRREELEQVLVDQVRRIVADDDFQQRLRVLLRVNLDKAAEESETLGSVPLPAAVVRPLVRGVGQVVLETTLETLVASLESDEGQQAARALVGSVLEQLFAGPWRSEVDELAREISIHVIDEMKAAVSVKKWAQEKSAGDEEREPQ